MIVRPQLTGWLSLIPTASGGRRSAIATGYRPQARIPGSVVIAGGDALEDVVTDCAIELEGLAELQPGETAHVRVTPVSPEYWRRLGPRDTVTLVEGRRAVGSVIVEIGLDPETLTEWFREREEQAHPADLEERVERIRRATDDFVRRQASRDIQRR